MQHFYFLLGLLALFVLLTVLSLWQSVRRRMRLPYMMRHALLLPSEQALLPVLDVVLGHGYRVYTKMPLAAMIGVQPNLPRRDRLRAADRLVDRYVDFAVCETAGSNIVCAIELTRLAPSASSSRLARLCDAAGLPLARIRRKETYTPRDVRAALISALRQRGRAARFFNASDADETLSAGAQSPEVPQEHADTHAQLLSPHLRGESAGLAPKSGVAVRAHDFPAKGPVRSAMRREPILNAAYPVANGSTPDSNAHAKTRSPPAPAGS